MTRSLLRFVLFTALLLSPVFAPAHNGPPFPILENQKAGPCIVELWIHPDVGPSLVFVVAHPLPGHAVPQDLKMEVGVQPESGRLKEVLYGMSREDKPDYVQYNGQVEFDQDEMWKIHLLVYSGGVTQEAYARVEATPVTLGRWDLLWFAAPFAGAGFLWFKVAVKRRQIRKRLAAS